MSVFFQNSRLSPQVSTPSLPKSSEERGGTEHADRACVDEMERGIASPILLAVKAEMKYPRPTYTTGEFCRSACRLFTAACVLLGSVLPWTSPTYDSAAKQRLLDAAYRMSE